MVKVNQTRTSILRRNSAADSQNVARCSACVSSIDWHKSRSNSRSSLSGTRKQSFPPLPKSDTNTSKECMACLKNIIAQKKSDIEAKASQFLENKPVPSAVCAQSPVVGTNSRRMTASIEREGRSSNKSPYMCMEQTGG